MAAACTEEFKENYLPLPEQTDEPGNGGGIENPAPESSYNEQFRPQIHYTPSRNWMNDPNGLVYDKGVWHLFYQYNPQGNDWGNMSWGHATSSDLIHWAEQPVAMRRNEWGDIFSGSAVIDADNTAGFGAGAMVAIYTSSGSSQQQSIAYSTDGGKTFTQYAGNPVIANTDKPDFRDPKVFWHKESNQWIMALALGWSAQVEFWGSPDLKNWSKLSTFTTDAARSNFGQWECPDLIRMEYKGAEKWVLIVSNNPGGPVRGSGTEYFVGNFDGSVFTADPLDYPLWLDYGSDNYAGVTWSNVPDGRTLLIGWMNNWDYCGNVPASPWRSAMTLPRELTLVETPDGPVLASQVVREIESIAGSWTAATGGRIGAAAAYEAKVSVSMSEKTELRLANDSGQYLGITVNPGAGCLVVNRSSVTGAVDFNPNFSIPSMVAPLHTAADEVELHFFVDQSSVEIFTADGTTASTVLVFPTSIYNRLEGADGVEYRELKSIW